MDRHDFPMRSPAKHSPAKGSLSVAVGLMCLSILVFWPASSVAAEAEVPEPDGTGVYGEGSGEGPIVAIADLVADPDAFEGKEVRVQGKVSGVCPKRGCWMELRDADDHRLRVKVEDGVIVFPLEAEGLDATAQGVVRIMEMTRERYAAWLQHLAEEKGETFDDSTLGEGPFRIVQLAGTGAEIGS